MFTDKKELVKQVNWALRLQEPFCSKQVNEVQSKWTSAGYEVRFDGGCGMIAHFEGRILALAWQQMGDVARYLFAKDCDELLHRDVKELGHFDHGYLESLFHLLKECDGDKRILMGQDIQFEDLMNFVGINCGFYFDLGHIASGVYAVSGNYREAELREKAFVDSLEIKCFSHHK